MRNINIKFEGFVFITKINRYNKITITSEMICDYNKKEFFHMRGVLKKAIQNGRYNKIIIDAIVEQRDSIEL